jgi:hypothetical protein
MPRLPVCHQFVTDSRFRGVHWSEPNVPVPEGLLIKTDNCLIVSTAFGVSPGPVTDVTARDARNLT